MTATLAPLVNSLASAESAVSLTGYYRSKLFITPCASNPMVAAAGPLLSITGRLGITQTLPPIESLRENIAHEMQAFHSKMHAHGYAAEQMSLAGYLLCATIDELVGKNYLRVHQQPAEFQAFTPAGDDEAGPQKRFFEIVQFIREKPNQYLDLIELAWFCLIAGFEGCEYLSVNGKQTLDNLMEDLYQLIQQYRVNKSHKLFNHAALTHFSAKPDYLPTILTVSACLLFIVAILFTSHIVLDNKAGNLLQIHTLLNSEEDD